MTEKQKLLRHYQNLINQLSSFQSSSHAIENIQLHLSQIHSRLNPDSYLNTKINCPGCCVVRTTSTHEITEGLPIQKNQCRRQKQIQKLRKLKKLTKKQDSLLKKLLMFKNGYQKIICRICGYIVKLPPIREKVDCSMLSKPAKQINVQTKENLLKKKEKRKTAGLNPLYAQTRKPSIPPDDKLKFSSETFQKPKNIEKLSLMLETSKPTRNNRLKLLLE